MVVYGDTLARSGCAALRRQGSQVRILSGAPKSKGANGLFWFCRCPRDRTLFDKTRQRFGRRSEATTGRKPQNRLGAILANPVGRANLFKYL